MADLEGFIQILSALVPTNDNPRAWVTWNSYIKGSDQIFDSVSSMVAFHPNRMVSGMEARIINYPVPGNITRFVMATDPATLIDGNGDSIITNDNLFDYWSQIEDIGTTTGFERVYEYAPDGSGGGAPPFPYTSDPGFESNWDPVYDAVKGHKWIRFRDDDVDANADDIFDNWTAPIPINQSYTSGDYIDIRFRRQAVSTVVHTAVGTMTNNLYYIVGQGSITDNTLGVTHTKGKVFQYLSANSYTFNTSPVSANCTETVQPISRTDGSGNPNNEPVGWSDTVPAGTDQLWKATGQKSQYGQLKSAWIIVKVNEDPNYVRYSNAASPYPGTIVDIDTDATNGSQGDTDLNAEGWSAVYSNQVFIATRSDDQNPSSPKYTPWLVQKIAEESGEYVDRVYKLYPVGLDADSVLVIAPTKRDATEEGWSDIPLEEPANQINYYSEARKFIDGTLKSNWTRPFPYTGQDAFADSIVSDLGDEFKIDQDQVITPAEIELTALLYRGTTKLWEQTVGTITYTWKKIYDNGTVVDVSPTSNSGDDFYTKPATAGAPGLDEFLIDQRVGIKPGAVTGKAVFECTQVFDPGSGAPTITFVDTYSIIDVSDGIDAKSLAVRSDARLIIWDSNAALFAPEQFLLSAFQSNIPTGNTFYWYRYVGGAWVEFTTGDANHGFPGGVNGNQIVVNGVSGGVTAVSDAVFTVPGAGAQATITSALSELPAMNVSDEFLITDHSQPENNGIYVVVTVNTSTSDYEVDKIGTTPASPVSAAAEAITVQTSLSKLLTTDQNKQELRYAVTNTQGDPDTADYDTKFSDYITITKLGSTSTGENGSNSVGMLLSNESHTITLDSTTGEPITGQTGNAGTATSIVELFDGQTHLDYGVDYTAGNVSIVTKSTDTGNLNDVLFDWEAAGNNIRIFVQAEPGGWVGSNNVRSGVAQVSITYGGNTYVKDFTVTSVVDAPGAIILDIDSDRGFSFVPSDRADKTLTAQLFDNNVVDVSDNYTYRWLLNGSQIQAKTVYSSGGHTYNLQSSQIQGGGYITCEVYTNPADVLTRSRTIYIQDITDAKSYLLYYNYSAEPGEPIATPATPANSTVAGFDTDYPAVGSNAWGRTPGDWTYWTSQGVEQDNKSLVFTAPARIRGEKGIQGLSGRFFIEQYNSNGNNNTTPPALPSATGGSGGGIGTNGWSTSLPATDVVWGTRRQFEADGVTPVSGTSWSNAYLITGKDGTNGVGIDGPGYDSISLIATVGNNQLIRFNGINGAPNYDLTVLGGADGQDGADGVIDGADVMYGFYVASRTTNGACSVSRIFGSYPTVRATRTNTGQYNIDLYRDNQNVWPLFVGFGHTNVKVSVVSITRRNFGTILIPNYGTRIAVGVSDDASLNDANFRCTIFQY